LLLVGLVLAWLFLGPLVAFLLAFLFVPLALLLVALALPLALLALGLGVALSLMGVFFKWLLPVGFLLLGLWLLLSPKRPIPEGW